MKNSDPFLLMLITRNLPIIPGMRFLGSIFENIYLRKKRSPISTKIFSYDIVLNPHEAVERELCFSPQLFDWREIKFLKNILRRGDIFLDLGCNVGGYSLALCNLIGESGLIISVDADNYSTNSLSKTVLKNNINNIKIVNIGLSDCNENLTYTPNVNGNRGGGNFHSNPIKDSFNVKCITLSNLLSKFPNITNIRAAKLDLEGFEYKVLKQFFNDSPKTLWPEYILVERSEDFIKMTKCDIKVLLNEYSYRLIFNHGMNLIFKKN
jgi:FkbM family methyltransferase